MDSTPMITPKAQELDLSRKHHLQSYIGRLVTLLNDLLYVFPYQSEVETRTDVANALFTDLVDFYWDEGIWQDLTPEQRDDEISSLRIHVYTSTNLREWLPISMFSNLEPAPRSKEIVFGA